MALSSPGIYVDGSSTTGGFVVDGQTQLSVKDIAGLAYALEQIDQNIIEIQETYIKKDGTVGFVGTVDMGDNLIKNVAYPVDGSDAATKDYVDDLGHVFSYDGQVVPSGSEETAFDVTTLQKTSAGAYYTASANGYVTDGTKTVYLNEGDAILFDDTGSYQKIDNSSSIVTGSSPFITVTGSPDQDYRIDLHQNFKERIVTLEEDTVRFVAGDYPIVINNADDQRPTIGIEEVSQAESGAMSALDKRKLDGIQSGAQVNVPTNLSQTRNDVEYTVISSTGNNVDLLPATDSLIGLMTPEQKEKLDNIEAEAQVNTVNSVNGYIGIVNLSQSDVGLSNVDNFYTATVVQATAGTLGNRFVTPEGVRGFVENGDYVIDGGTF